MEYATDEEGMPIGELPEEQNEEIKLFQRFSQLPRAPWDWLLSLFSGDPMRFNYFDRYSTIHGDFEEMQGLHSNAYSGFQLIAHRHVTKGLTLNHVLSYLFPENHQPYSIALSHSYGPFEGKFFPILTSLFVNARIIPQQLALLTDYYLNFMNFSPKLMGYSSTEIGVVCQTVSSPNPNAPFFGGGEIDIKMPTSHLGFQYNVRDSSWGANFCQCIGERWMAGTSFESAQGIAILSQAIRHYRHAVAYSALCQWHTMTGFFSASLGVIQRTYVGANVLASFSVSPQQAQGGGVAWEPSANVGISWDTINGDATVAINSDGILTSQLAENSILPFGVTLTHQVNLRTMEDHKLGLKFEFAI